MAPSVKVRDLIKIISVIKDYASLIRKRKLEKLTENGDRGTNGRNVTEDLVGWDPGTEKENAITPSKSLQYIKEIV